MVSTAPVSRNVNTANFDCRKYTEISLKTFYQFEYVELLYEYDYNRNIMYGIKW